MVSTPDLIAGILTISPLIIGYIMGIITLRIYLKGGSRLVLLTSILFFALPSPWLGVSTVFLGQILGLGVPNDTLYVFIYAWSVPIIALIWNYTSVSLLKFSEIAKWIVMVLVVVIDLVFLWSIYIVKDFEVHPIDDSIFLDSTFTGLAALSSTIIVLSVLIFVAPLYFWISFQTEDRLFTFKSRFIGTGAITFSVSAGLDANIALSNIALIVIVRLALVISLVFLYLGYNTPDFIRRRFD